MVETSRCPNCRTPGPKESRCQACGAFIGTPNTFNEISNIDDENDTPPGPLFGGIGGGIVGGIIDAITTTDGIFFFFVAPKLGDLIAPIFGAPFGRNLDLIGQGTVVGAIAGAMVGAILSRDFKERAFVAGGFGVITGVILGSFIGRL